MAITLRDKLRNARAGSAPDTPPATFAAPASLADWPEVAAFIAKAGGGKGGGHWVTTAAGRHLLIGKGGQVIAGLGKQAGKGPLAGKDGGHADAGKGAAHPGGGRSYTEAQYAKAHGIGGANAFAHLDKLHREGKVAKDPKTGAYFVPGDAPHPPGSKAAKPASPPDHYGPGHPEYERKFREASARSDARAAAGGKAGAKSAAKAPAPLSKAAKSDLRVSRGIRAVRGLRGRVAAGKSDWKGITATLAKVKARLTGPELARVHDATMGGAAASPGHAHKNLHRTILAEHDALHAAGKTAAARKTAPMPAEGYGPKAKAKIARIRELEAKTLRDKLRNVGRKRPD